VLKYIRNKNKEFLNKFLKGAEYMNKIKLGTSEIEASEIVVGCMRIGEMSVADLGSYVNSAIEEGVTLFDHADIYGGGSCEEIFGDMLVKNKGLREKIQIQSKCSITNGYYDFSKEHILHSVDGILKRLKTDYLDILVLHRPDTLMEPCEVAEAFEALQKSGKVQNFGVSNCNSMQIELLKTCVSQPILVNQLQFGIMHSGMVDSGIQANTQFSGSVDHDGSILEYSRINKITIQAWSPFQYGFFDGVFIDNEKFPELNQVLDRISKEKGVSKSTLAVAWILKHPAKMQTVVGTTRIDRLREICKATQNTLSKAEWYEIYKVAGNIMP